MPKPHKAVIHHAEKLSNAAVAFHARCCDDKASDLVLTFYLRPGETAEAAGARADVAVAAHIAKTQQLHAAHDAVDAVLTKFKGGKQ